jgi:hypothetical protein
LYYAKQFNADPLIPILECEAAVSSKEEAQALSRFFWQMLDAAAEDRDNHVEVLGEKDLQRWMERSMNIISGYLERIGYHDEWDKVSDEN